eukprot:GFKZ01006534.1.p1 GENE.GFKZ01006534.1~~GFKZ01006534.1.p1  ORF type:complete len:418 (+),score=119.96 GFKZ01006534.1:217-1470(+)
MDSDKYAFWGIALKPGEPADLELQDGETLHVTMASYGVELNDEKGRSVVTATVHGSDHKHGLAVLNAGVTESRVMDVSFIGEESVSFEVSGKNVVHLVGNFSFEEDMEGDSDSDEEGDTLIGVYDDQDVDSDEDDDDETAEPKLLMANDAPVITELTEDEEEEEKPVKRKEKKDRLPNGKHKATPEDAKPKEDKDTAKTSKKESGKHGKKKDEKNVSFRAKSDAKKDKGGHGKVADETKAKETHPADMDDAEDEDGKPDQEVKGPVKAADLHQGDNDDATNGSADSDEIQPEKPKPQATPKSGGGRNKKRKQANAASSEATTPTSKKSKLSQRPATPAAVKNSQKPAKAETPQKPGQKEITSNKDGNGGNEANGDNVEKNAPDTPIQEKARGPGDSTGMSKSQKRRKKKSKKNANAS